MAGPESKHHSYLSKNTTLFRDIIETYDQEEKDEETKHIVKDGQDINCTKNNDVSCLSRITDLINQRKNSYGSVTNYHNNISAMFEAGSSIYGGGAAGLRDRDTGGSGLSGSNQPTTNPNPSYNPIL